MSVGCRWEVVQHVGQGGRQGAVVLRRDDHEGVRLLDGLVSVQHPLGGRGLVLQQVRIVFALALSYLHEVERLLK